MKLEDILKKELESIDHDHLSSSTENPIREDAFDISDSEKIKLIEEKVRDMYLGEGKYVNRAHLWRS